MRLDILEVPWDSDGREIVRSEMENLGVNQDDLYIALRNAGWNQSSTTLGRWLRGQSVPSSDELALLTSVLASYPDNWPKASNVSSAQTGYSFWLRPFDVGLTPGKAA